MDEDQRGIEVLVVLLDIFCIIFGRLPLVYCIEVETGVVNLNGLEEHSESILKTTSLSDQPSEPYNTAEHTILDRFAMMGPPSHFFHPSQGSPCVVTPARTWLAMSDVGTSRVDVGLLWRLGRRGECLAVICEL